MKSIAWLVWKRLRIPRSGLSRPGGFALVTCLVLMALITALLLGLISLASIEIRRTAQNEPGAAAKANARLALMQAIGQLQKTLGPDQRVSASAEILAGNPRHPQWTGVWRTTQNDGSSFFTRDDLSGGLSDARWKLESTPAQRALEWLVSGTGDPFTAAGSDPITLLHGDAGSIVEVPRVTITNGQGRDAGHIAWWTGDLGVRVNLRTRDARQDLQISRNNPANGAWFRVMMSQAADSLMMKGGVAITDQERQRLVSSASIALTSLGAAWRGQHSLDYTVDSCGVLADVAHGGLKRDLTAFFSTTTDVPAWSNLAGLSAKDPLVGDTANSNGTSSRLTVAGPRFGLLRDWARLSVPFAGSTPVGSCLPETDVVAGQVSAALPLANKQPVKLAGNVRASLEPILVEATNFTQISTFPITGTDPPQYQLRHLQYPRVVLWNPYNVELNFARAIIMIQGNGRQEMHTRDEHTNRWNGGKSYSESEWLSFEGGRGSAADFAGSNRMATVGYNDPFIGSYYFAIPATRFAAGECLVFSPANLAEYNCLSPYHPGAYNLNANELSCQVAPDPARCYYISSTNISGGREDRPIEFWYAPTPAWSAYGRNGIENQADDSRAVLKHIGTSGTINFADFDNAPQITVLSASLQYGAGREPRTSWNKGERMTVELLDQINPRPTKAPNVRTREGIRLRWFDEHPSNLANSGKLNNTAHFEDSLLGNWNPRASFAVRSPWENIAGTMPTSGSAGGPWFFGAYTRDLYDQQVSWEEQVPVPRNGRFHGNPFGRPQEGAGRYVLFDVPRSETGVISLGQLQHAKISELIWHPSYAIGNSLVDPRLGTGGYKGISRTAAIATDAVSVKSGGFHENQLGWSSDTQRSSSKSEWAVTARALLGGVPTSDNLVYDLSFEANQTLWDRFFLSTGSPAEKDAFIADPELNPLPNGRMKLANRSASAASLKDFHKAAANLMVDGAFNVNSTRVEAWQALLGSARLSSYGGGSDVPFPRVLDAPEGVWKNGDSPDLPSVWAGHRELTTNEIHNLAVAITNEVKLRGPFLSLADFVNRRLAEDETGRMGALEAAIQKAGLNSGLTAEWGLNNQSSLPDYTHPDHIPDPTRMEQTLKPASKAWGAPAWLTQGDLLQTLGPILSARSDTFVIRAYGDAVDATGIVSARAWCEAVVQRTPVPLDPDGSGLNPRLAGAAGDFGRRFLIVSFRWLNPAEI